MKIFRALPKIASRQGLALTLGVFDGVHKGHTAILKVLKRKAAARGIKNAVLTFNNHPATVLSPSYAPPALCSRLKNLESLAAAGVDELYLLRFTPAFSKQPAELFARNILAKRLKVKELVIGYDFVFGRQGLGDHYLLKELGKDLGFKVSSVPAAMIESSPVSSTRIRSAVMAGDMVLAEKLLGRPYELRGTVVKGKGWGRQLGWPTANLKLEGGLLPKAGVWGGRCRIEGETSKAWHPFIANLGSRPTIEIKGELKLEIHLLDFERRLNGKKLTVQFERYLRAEKAFPSLQALQTQIAKDEMNYKRHLER